MASGAVVKFLTSEDRFYWLPVILFFLALAFSEWRTINYHLCGSRSASPIDFIVLSGGAFFLVMQVKKTGGNYLLRQIFSLWYFLLPIALMAFLYTDQSALSDVKPSFTRYLLLGLTVYMLLSGLALARYPEKKILAYLMVYILIVTVFFLVVYVFTRFYPLKSFMYGMGTPSLNFPFESPNQTALFMLLNLILGVGVVLVLRKFYFLYLIVPVMVLGVFQTGSRSLAMLLIMGGVAFILLILFQWIYSKICPWRESINLLLSVALATAALFLTMDAQSERALSIFNFNLVEIANGKVDNYRDNANKLWRSGSGLKSEITEGSIEKGTCWSDLWDKPVVEPMVVEPMVVEPMVVEPMVALNGGAHNAYLDLWLNWGKLSFASFLVFLLVMFFSLMSLLWHKRTATSYPLYGALLIGMGVIVGAIYANPLLHLKFVWVFFGLIISFLLTRHSDYMPSGNLAVKIERAP